MHARHETLRASLTLLKSNQTCSGYDDTTANRIREEQQRIDAEKAAHEATIPDYDSIAHANEAAGNEPY